MALPNQPADVTRATLEDALINADLDCNQDKQFVYELMLNGFDGYKNRTDDDIEVAIIQSFSNGPDGDYTVDWDAVRAAAKEVGYMR